MPVISDRVDVKEEKLSSTEVTSSEDSDSETSTKAKEEPESDDDDVILDQSASTSDGAGSTKKSLKGDKDDKSSVRMDDVKKEKDYDSEDLSDQETKPRKISWREKQKNLEEKDNMSRVKPDFGTDRDRERGLVKIATRYVRSLADIPYIQAERNIT